MLDPITISCLARIRQQELLEWAAKDQGDGLLEEWLGRLSASILNRERKPIHAAMVNRKKHVPGRYTMFPIRDGAALVQLPPITSR